MEENTWWLEVLTKAQLLALSRRLGESNVRPAGSKSDVVECLAEWDTSVLCAHMIGTELARVLSWLDLPVSGSVGQKRLRLEAVLVGGEPDKDESENLDPDAARQTLGKLAKGELLLIAEYLNDPDIKTNWRKKRILTELSEYYPPSTIADAIDALEGGREVDGESDSSVSGPQLTWPSNAEFSRARCLVIGVADYEDQPLANPLLDARAMERVLSRLGHVVEQVLENPTKTQIRAAVKRLAKSIKGDEGALVYFSGHGVAHEGRNWVAPLDFDPEDDDDIEEQAFPADGFLKMLKRAKFRVVVLDACRSRGLAGELKRGINQGGLRAMSVNADINSMIWFATSPGSYASDGVPGKHGEFTEALLEHLGAPGATLEEVDRAVRKAVYEATAGKQVPWSNTSFIEPWYPAGP